MYNKESDFCKALVAKLKKCGLHVTRIETHSTGVGVPDMFVQGCGDDYWIELKNDNKQSINNEPVKIPFRPGQKAWHINYNIYHMRVKCSWVFMACKDGVLCIRILELDMDVYKFTYDEWEQVNLLKFLRANTYATNY